MPEQEPLSRDPADQFVEPTTTWDKIRDQLWPKQTITTGDHSVLVGPVKGRIAICYFDPIGSFSCFRKCLNGNWVQDCPKPVRISRSIEQEKELVNKFLDEATSKFESVLKVGLGAGASSTTTASLTLHQKIEKYV